MKKKLNITRLIGSSEPFMFSPESTTTTTNGVKNLSNNNRPSQTSLDKYLSVKTNSPQQNLIIQGPNIDRIKLNKKKKFHETSSSSELNRRPHQTCNRPSKSSKKKHRKFWSLCC